jgi:hypothetical protein
MAEITISKEQLGEGAVFNLVTAYKLLLLLSLNSVLEAASSRLSSHIWQGSHVAS